MFNRNSLGDTLNRFVFFRLIGNNDDALGAFGTHTLRNLYHAVAFRTLADLLAASHGDSVVVQNFVGDIDACRNRLAHRQQATVKIGAVT